MRVALVYDRVNKIGGAERVLEALHEIFPNAPLYTAVYNPKTAPWAEKFNVIPSFLNKFPFAKRSHEVYPWLTPLAFESFNFDEYDIVISVTSEAAKGTITKPKTLHICYCLTPTRYLWSGYEDYFKNEVFRFFTKPVVSYLRRWDKVAAQRPDVYIAISENVKKRIKKYYGRDSEVIYPPVDIDKFPISNFQFPIGEYFLIVSRLVPYKKVDIAIQAFNKLGLPLKIIGVGREMGRLKRMAKKNIEFLGQLTDSQLLSYYQRCQAVIFPQEEDFGLVPLEAQACGKPVIAYRGGGALETVIESKTGEFFEKQTSESLGVAVKNFKPEKYNPEDCRKQAEKFDIKIFKKKWKTYLENISTL
ncbi:MAG: group 1 glycosyl transferase [Microgenomates group bacterium LiPW_31]|nr:MAG: group 1 glycosyl transferase [Microgenomates group bacterium LiPW_31]